MVKPVDGHVSNTQIRKLREKTAEFMATTFLDALNTALHNLGVMREWYRLDVQPGGVADRDPQVLELHYQSVLDLDDLRPCKMGVFHVCSTQEDSVYLQRRKTIIFEKKYR
jgi:hypothetical protein